MRKRSRHAAILALAVALVAALGASAWAVTVTPTHAPSENPFWVPRDAAGNPQFFDISATGLGHNEPAFVEVCDGVSPTTQSYSSSQHCDLASGGEANTDSSGNVTFHASDSNERLNIFVGLSPQGFFNCVGPTDALPNNGQPSYRNCQVRVSGGTSGDTTEQAYFTLSEPDAPPAAPSNIGSCSGQVGLVTFPKTKLLTDAVQTGLKATSHLLSDVTVTPHPVLGGSCTVPAQPGTSTPNPAGSVGPHSMSLVLTGNASCAPTPRAPWPLNGKATITMNDTYTDTVSGALKHYQVQAQLEITGQDYNAGPDIYKVQGTVLFGLGVGSSVSGNIWIDPVLKLSTKDPAYPGALNTGYALDTASVNGCEDGVPGNLATPITTLMFGTSSLSLRGYPAAGLTFTQG
jgi:hypothetical protein